MTRTCKTEGCARIVQARGMCNRHYKVWQRATTMSLAPIDTCQLILDAMPGTHQQLARETGFCYDTVLRKVRQLRDEGRAHIGDIEHPVTGMNGTKFMPVFWAGPGKDKVITRSMRVKHGKLAWKRAHAIRILIQRGDPLVNATAGRAS